MGLRAGPNDVKITGAAVIHCGTAVCKLGTPAGVTVSQKHVLATLTFTHGMRKRRNTMGKRI